MKLNRNWQDNLTWEQILQLEAQGSDVTEIKEKFLKKQEEENQKLKNLEAMRFSTGQVDSKTIPNKTNISKLEAIINECKNPQSQLIRDTVGKPPLLFGKAKWRENIENSEILYVSVIQCHPQLWQRVTEDITPASYLFVYSLNPKYIRNIEVLKKVSELLNNFRDLPEIDYSKLSSEMIELYKDLNDPESTPHVVLDETLLGALGLDKDADIRITNNYIYDHTPLPNNRLPSDGILPFIRYREKNFDTDVNFSYATKIIPGKYYV